MQSFEILEHTADIGLRAKSDTLQGLFAAAAIGLTSIAVDCTDINTEIPYPITATAEDREALLVNWLNEVIFLLDGRQVVLGKFEINRLTDTEVSARAWGEPLDPARHPTHIVVKAATYHQLRIANENGIWTADVYLDI